MTADERNALIGHRFVGGTYRIAHWESWLLTDCTGSNPLPDDLVHPIALFHAPILGSGTSITELFALVGARGAGSVGLLGYDWEYLQPLREEIDYRCEGHVADVQRATGTDGRLQDTITFRFELFDQLDRPVAIVTNRWLLRR